MTIRELITEKSELLRDMDSVGPEQGAKELVELSSLLSSLNKEISDFHYFYNLKRVELLSEHQTVAKTKLYAEALPEWKEWQIRLEQRSAVEEMIRCLKFYLRGAEQEYKISKY